MNYTQNLKKTRKHKNDGPRNSGVTHYEQLDNESRNDNHSHPLPKEGKELRNTCWKNRETWYEKTKESTDNNSKQNHYIINGSLGSSFNKK